MQPGLAGSRPVMVSCFFDATGGWTEAHPEILDVDNELTLCENGSETVFGDTCLEVEHWVRSAHCESSYPNLFGDLDFSQIMERLGQAKQCWVVRVANGDLDSYFVPPHPVVLPNGATRQAVGLKNNQVALTSGRRSSTKMASRFTPTAAIA